MSDKTRGLWAILIAGCLANFLVFGGRAAFTGVFNTPVTQALGGDPRDFALAMAIQNILWGVGQPFAAAIAERYGSRLVLFMGGIAYGGGIVLSGMVTTPLMFGVTAGGLVGFGLATGSFAIVLGAMGRVVAPEKRAWAMGLATAAGSLGQVVLVPAAGFLIGATDWRTSMVALGICCLSFALLALVLGAKPSESPDAPGQQSFGHALNEARRHSSYWLLVLGFFVCGFHVTFVFVHMEPWVRDLGFDPSVAYISIMLIGAFNVIGAYSAGVMGDRLSKKNLLTFIYGARAALFALMVLIPPTPLMIYVYSAFLGLLWLSTVPLTSALVGVFFGPRYLGTLFGFAFFSHQVGAFLGSQLGGIARKEFGSYDAMWWMMVALGIVAALLHWPIREKPVDRLLADARA